MLPIVVLCVERYLNQRLKKIFYLFRVRIARKKVEKKTLRRKDVQNEGPNNFLQSPLYIIFLQ